MKALVSLCIAAVSVLAITGLGRSASADGLPIALAQYERILSKVHDDAIEAAAGVASAPQAADAALGSIALIPVRLPSGQLLIADNRPIIALAQRAESSASADDAALVWSQIASEVGQVSAGEPEASSAPGSSSAVAKVRELLTTKEFSSQPIAPPSVWDRMGDALSKWIRDLLKKFHPTSPPGSPPEWVTRIVPEALLIIIIAVAVGFILYFIMSAVRSRMYSSRMESGELGLALTSEERDLVASYNYSRLRELAEEAAERGDYRSAFRLTFIATLVFLNLEGAVKFDKSKTNWEYLRSMSARPELRAELRPLVTDFDRIWYGSLDAGASDFERATARYDSIRRIVADSLGPLDAASERRLKKTAGVA